MGNETNNPPKQVFADPTLLNKDDSNQNTTPTLTNTKAVNQNSQQSTDSVICKNCKQLVPSVSFFCPTCGKKIKEPPYKFSFLGVTGVVLESVLLPPMGIVPGIRYLRREETSAKMVGLLAIIITIAATVFMVAFLMNYINSVNSQLNDVNYLNNIYSNPQGSVQNQANELQKLNQ